jgi:LPXTG-site transpeptidase (sortase) family protein
MGSHIKNNAFSCIGSLLVNIGLILVFGVVLATFASQMTRAAEREFARKQAAGEVPEESMLKTIESPAEGYGAPQNDTPEMDVEAVLPDPEVEEESAGPVVLVSKTAAPATVEAQKRQPTRLVIPMLELDAPVKAAELLTWQEGTKLYTQWAVPDEFAAGWHGDSAPLGEVGNTVLNGHHNVYGEVFRDLIYLPVGEEIIIYDGDQPFTYRVTNMELLRNEGIPLRERLANGRWFHSTEDERLTLTTCWPYTSNTHRLVVVAYPVDGEGLAQMDGGG